MRNIDIRRAALLISQAAGVFAIIMFISHARW